MAAQPLSDEKLQQAVDAYAKFASQTKAAEHVNVSRATFQCRLNEAKRRGIVSAHVGFEREEIPDESLSIEDLLERRKKQYLQAHKAKVARKLINIKIKLDGPIAIAHLGDPHVDDDGCDIAQLERDQDTIRNTPGMFGANLGDLQNNWVGRIAHLWAQQSTSAAEAWKLVEWHVNSLPWLYLVGGNHDAWSGNGDPLNWIMAQQPGAFGYNGTRINLVFPNGRQIRINARHDFTGHSMWNPAHGPMKAAQSGWRDHILTCGHKHISFVAGPLKDPASGLLTWAMRCAGYKVHDRYADEKGLPDQNAFAAAVTIIDPQYADDDRKLITVIPDVQEGAEFLAFKRERAAA